jgi:DNA-binding XRE family transcriptional regulator
VKTVYGAEWLLPEAPEMFDVGRDCIMGAQCVVYEQTARWGDPRVGKLNRYSREQGYGDEKYALCGSCDKLRIKRGQDLRQFLGPDRIRKKRAKNANYYYLCNLSDKRDEKGWTQAKLGKEAGLGEDTVGALEREDRAAEPRSLAALAKALGCCEDSLWKES